MDEIEDDDYRVFPTGPLGGMTGVSQSHKFLDTFTEMEDALAFIDRRMNSEKYWPAIWWVSDHGNAWQIDREGNEILTPTEEA